MHGCVPDFQCFHYMSNYFGEELAPNDYNLHLNKKLIRIRMLRLRIPGTAFAEKCCEIILNFSVNTYNLNGKRFGVSLKFKKWLFSAV
jgi:hypothetical protein